jgi:hypothetical protein
MFLFFIFASSVVLSCCLLNPPTTNQKFCVECKHFKKDRSYFLGTSNGKCALFPIIDSISNREHDDEKIEYLVSGERNDDIDYSDCVKARQSETMCGQEGKFFKKKNKCFIDKSRWKLGSTL